MKSPSIEIPHSLKLVLAVTAVISAIATAAFFVLAIVGVALSGEVIPLAWIVAKQLTMTLICAYLGGLLKSEHLKNIKNYISPPEIA